MKICRLYKPNWQITIIGDSKGHLHSRILQNTNAHSLKKWSPYISCCRELVPLFLPFRNQTSFPFIDNRRIYDSCLTYSSAQGLCDWHHNLAEDCTKEQVSGWFFQSFWFLQTENTGSAVAGSWNILRIYNNHPTRQSQHNHHKLKYNVYFPKSRVSGDIFFE